MPRRNLWLRSHRDQGRTQRLFGNSKADLLLWENHGQEKIRVMSIWGIKPQML